MKAIVGFILAFWLIGLAVVIQAIRRPGGKLITIRIPLTEPADDVQPVDPRAAAYLEDVRRAKAEPAKWGIIDGFLQVVGEP